MAGVVVRKEWRVREEVVRVEVGSSSGKGWWRVRVLYDIYSHKKCSGYSGMAER